MTSLKVLLLICTLVLCSNASFSEQMNPKIKYILNHFDMFNHDNNLTEKRVLSKLKDLMSDNKPNTFTSLSVNLSSECVASLQDLIRPAAELILKNKTNELAKWFQTSSLLYYIDSWGKPSSRFSVGNFGWYGGYDECKQIENSHYCLAEMIVLGNKLLPGAYGTCIPKRCTSNDVFKMLTILHPYADKIIEFPANGLYKQTYGSPVMCNDKKSLPADAIVIITICAILGLLCFLGTITEGLQDCLTPDQLIPIAGLVNVSDVDQRDEHTDDNNVAYQRCGQQGKIEITRGNRLTNFLICFSILKNSRAILSTELPSTVIPSINGIRAISMTWVILGHVYFFSIYNSIDNPKIAFQITQRFTFQAIANAYVSVDSFFLLSGFLVSYLAMKRMEKTNGKLNLPLYYIHRLIRLTPTYMFVIFIHSSLIPVMMDSPTGFTLEAQRETCRKYWWTNLLYINNFYPSKFTGECLAWSWYLANDMQFYIISPIFLYIFYRYKLRGAIISVSVGILISVISITTLVVYNDLPALITEAWLPHPVRRVKVQQFADEVYSKPYTRIAPYLIGLLLGYIIKQKIHIARPKLWNALLGWTLAFGIGLSVIYGPYTVFKPGGQLFDATQNAFYASFSRIAWAVALGWVIYACHHKMGGVINSFLSWKAWVPLSRLTYGAYLLHPIILNYYYRSMENSLHYQDVTMIFRFLSVVVVSYALAFLMALIIDLPVFNLEKIVLKKLGV